MRTSIFLVTTAALLAAVSVRCQDLLGVTWSGAVVHVDSYTAAVTPVGTGLAGQNSLARDGNGIYWSSRGTPTSTVAYALTMIDPNTGSAMVMFPGMDLRGLSTGPGTSLYGINDQGTADRLVSIDTTTGTITPIGPTGFSGIQGLAMHQGVLYAWDVNQGLLILDPVTGAGLDPFPGLGGPLGLQSLCSHPDGRLLVSGGSSTNSLFVVDVGTGLTTLVGVMSGANDLRGLEPLGGYVTSFGQACNGVHGPTTLTVTGLPAVGGTLVSASGNHAPNSVGAVIFGLSTTFHAGLNLPFLLDPAFGTSNCHLYSSIDASVIVVTGATAPAQMQLSMPLGAGAVGARFHMQHACFEPVAGNLSFSNGVTVQVQ